MVMGGWSLWYPAPPGVPDELAAAEPARFFRPTPSEGGVFSGWFGMFLDTSGEDEVDWTVVAAALEGGPR
jgi:hypothetical protein